MKIIIYKNKIIQTITFTANTRLYATKTTFTFKNPLELWRFENILSTTAERSIIIQRNS